MKKNIFLNSLITLTLFIFIACGGSSASPDLDPGLDSDGDGIVNADDNCPDVANPDQADANADGVGDICEDIVPELDSDGDGVFDADDNCPDVANPDQADANADGVGDVCEDVVPEPESDVDGDGVADAEDNCPDVANPDQADTEIDIDLDGEMDLVGNAGDGEGNACEFKLTEDSLVRLQARRETTISVGLGRASNLSEEDNLSYALYYSVEDNIDSIEAILANGTLVRLGAGNTGVAINLVPDTDYYFNAIVYRGLGTVTEESIAYAKRIIRTAVPEVNPDDLDGDGFLNADDNCPETYGINQVDSDGDGFGDICDGDMDGDGLENDNDNCPHRLNADQADSDGDGVGDKCELQLNPISTGVSFGEVTTNSFQVSFTAANGPRTVDIEYSIYISTSDNLNSVDEVINNGILRYGPGRPSRQEIDGLQSGTRYYVNVLAADTINGDQIVYNAGSIATLTEALDELSLLSTFVQEDTNYMITDAVSDAENSFVIVGSMTNQGVARSFVARFNYNQDKAVPDPAFSEDGFISFLSPTLQMRKVVANSDGSYYILGQQTGVETLSVVKKIDPNGNELGEDNIAMSGQEHVINHFDQGDYSITALYREGINDTSIRLLKRVSIASGADPAGINDFGPANNGLFEFTRANLDNLKLVKVIYSTELDRYFLLMTGFNSATAKNEALVIAVTGDGRLDATFANEDDGNPEEGIFVNPNQENVVATGMILDSQNRLVVLSTISNGDNQDFYLIRLNANDGLIDQDFGQNGFLTYDAGSNKDVALSIKENALGTTYLLGGSTRDPQLDQSKGVLVRFAQDGDALAEQVVSDAPGMHSVDFILDVNPLKIVLGNYMDLDRNEGVVIWNY